MAKDSDSSTPTPRSIGTVIIDAFKIGGMPLALVVCGAITIVLSQALVDYTWLCLLVGLVLVLAGVGDSLLSQSRQFGPLIGFTKRLEGWWWERIRPDNSAALSLVCIEPNATTGTLRLRGRVFAADGRQIADWDSVDSCVNPVAERLFYYWTGLGRAVGCKPQNGYGEIDFDFSNPDNPRVLGDYSDTAVWTDGKLISKKTELRRAAPEDVKVATGNDATATAELVKARIKQFG
jgi:hypothetical protein